MFATCNPILSRLWGPLTKVADDPQLKKRRPCERQEKRETFNKLREALSIADPQGKRGLSDDGRQATIGSIEEKVKCFREEISQNKEYSKMIEQIDKYWDKLFAGPITVSTPTGPLEIQPQRTNNIMERFFRDLKRGNRKRSGLKSLSKTLRFLLADTPLVKNLDNPEYVEILLDGCGTLEERFSKIDSRLVVERLRAERKNQRQVSPGDEKNNPTAGFAPTVDLIIGFRQK